MKATRVYLSGSYFFYTPSYFTLTSEVRYEDPDIDKIMMQPWIVSLESKEVLINLGDWYLNNFNADVSKSSKYTMKSGREIIGVEGVFRTADGTRVDMTF